MEPSNSSRSRSNRSHRTIVLLDRAVLVALSMGLALYVIPVWREGRLRVAFWLTLGATILHIYTSHKRSVAESAPPPGKDP